MADSHEMASAEFVVPGASAPASDRLGVSLNTVNTQIRRMFEKCGVNNRIELINLLSGEGDGRA